MRSSLNTSAVRLLAVASVAVSLGACSTPAPEPSSAADAAREVLEEAITDTTQVVGFAIGADVTLLEGRTVMKRRLYPGDPDDAVPSTEGGPWVAGSDFDLDVALTRAEEELAGCSGGGRVDVRVLSPEATVTATTCDDDTVRVLLGDRELGALGKDAPAALTSLVDDLDEAGLADQVTSVEFDASRSTVTAAYRGDDPRREYRWIRGWATPSSLVTFSDTTPRTPMDPAALRSAPTELKQELSEGSDLISLVAAEDGGSIEVERA